MQLKWLEKVGMLLFGIAMIWGGSAIAAALMAHGTGRETGTVVDMCFVLLGAIIARIYGRNASRTVSKKAIVSLMVFMTLIGMASYAFVSFTTLSFPGLPSTNWFHVFPTKQFMTLRELGATFATGPIMILLKIAIFGPLMEEMLRGCLQKGLTCVMPETISLLLVALYFSISHDHRQLVVLPSFLLLGVLVRQGYSWLQRAVVHGLSNLLNVIDALTFGLGGYYVNKENHPSTLLIEFVIFSAISLFLYVASARFYLSNQEEVLNKKS